MGFWDSAGTTILDPSTGLPVTGDLVITPDLIQKTAGNGYVIGSVQNADTVFGEVPLSSPSAQASVPYRNASRRAGTTPEAGTTAARPAGQADGTLYFDTTLGLPVFALTSAGTGWVDAAGNPV